MNSRESNQMVVEKFFDALEKLDAAAVIELFADDIVQQMPYSPDWFPAQFSGKEQMAKQFTGITENFTSMKYDLNIMPLLDESKFLVRFTGIITLKNGQIYDNNYINLFTVKSGKIIEIIEYFNPVILEKGFGPQSA